MLRAFFQLALVVVVLGAITASAALLTVGFSTLATFEIAIESIEATVDIKPESLQLKDKGNPVKAFIQITGQNLNDIAPSTVKLCLPTNTCVKAVSGGVVEEDIFRADFDRAEVILLLQGKAGSTVSLVVTGVIVPPLLRFDGSDTIRVIDE